MVPLDHGNFLLQLFYFFVLEIVIGLKLGNLLVQKSNISLILVGHAFLFSFNFMERFMQSFHFGSIYITKLFEAILKLGYAGFPFLQSV